MTASTSTMSPAAGAALGLTRSVAVAPVAVKVTLRRVYVSFTAEAAESCPPARSLTATSPAGTRTYADAV